MTKDGLRMFWHKPVLIYGLGAFTTVYPQFRSFYTNAAHKPHKPMAEAYGAQSSGSQPIVICVTRT